MWNITMQKVNFDVYGSELLQTLTATKVCRAAEFKITFYMTFEPLLAPLILSNFDANVKGA